MLYALLLVGVLAMFGGTYFTGHTNGVKDQQAIDEPLIASAKAERALAVAANEGLQADLTRIRGDVNACNSQVAKIRADSDLAIAAMDKIIAESEARKRGYEVMLARFKAGANPTQPVPKDLQCEAARSALGDLSDHMRNVLGLDTPVETPPPRLTVSPTGAVTTTPKKRSLLDRARGVFK